MLTLFLVSAGQYPRNYSFKLPADFFSLLFLEILGLICAPLCALFSFFLLCFVLVFLLLSATFKGRLFSFKWQSDDISFIAAVTSF